MSEREVLEKLATAAFQWLVVDRGYSAPSVARDDHASRILFAKGDIGIEIELDWHEFAPFLLLVRLAGGRAPKGYYVDEGRRCRQHLAAALGRLRGTRAPKAGAPKRQSRADEARAVEASLREMSAQLAANVGDFEAQWDRLWATDNGPP